MMVAVFAISMSAQAQKLSKEEKAAAKAQKEAETSALMKNLFQSKNFQFVPTEVQTKTGGSVNINKYEYTRVRPDSFIVRMSQAPSIDVPKYELVTNEATKTGYIFTVKVEAGGSTNTISISVNSKTGFAQMRIKSNKAEELIYKGSIREN